MAFFGQLLVNGLMLGAVYALAAVAYTLVYGIVQLINFAFGELFMLGAFFTVSLMLGTVQLFGNPVSMPGLPIFIAAPLAIVIVSLLGLAIERVAYKPLRSAPRLAPLITAIAVSVLLQSLAETIWGGEELPFPQYWILQLPPLILLGKIYVSAIELVVLGIAFVAMVSLMLIVNYTRIGRAVRATAHDPQAAYLVGIPVDRIIGWTFAIGSGLAALAGILYAQAYGFVHPTMGFLPSLKALISAVLGGIGSVPGAALGGVLLALIETFGAGYLPSGSAYKDAIGFAILILLLFFRPQGLLGRKELNEAPRGSLLAQGNRLRISVTIANHFQTLATRMQRFMPRGMLVGIFLALAIILAFEITSDYWLRVLVFVLIYGLLATGLNIVVGFTGLLDLGFVAFWAVGAYFSSILFVLVLYERFGIQQADVWWLFYVNLLAGGLLASLFALALGYPTLRLRGDYLAIMTLGFGEIVRIIATNWVGLTRGPMGIRGIANPSLFGFSLDTPRRLYLFALVMTFMVLFAVSRLVKSYIGRAWVAIREDERAAETMAIDSSRYKLLAYASGGFIGGLVGVFFAHFQQYVGPFNFTLFDNILLLMLIVLGGLGTLIGPFVGAFIWITFLQFAQNFDVIQSHPEVRYALLGALLLCLMLFQPQGIAAWSRVDLMLKR